MDQRAKKDRIFFILEAALEYFITMFVTGTMLGYVLDTLGLSDAMQGVVSTAATFTCGAQLFALWMTGRRKKRVVVLGNLLNQSAFILLYVLPIVPLSPGARTALLLVLLIGGHAVSNGMLISFQG